MAAVEKSQSNRRGAITTVALLAALGLALMPVDDAWGATIIVNGPIDLGTADSFGVLGATAVTNTDFSVITGDLGISPGTAVTGFPPGTYSGAFADDDAVALQAQIDLVAAMNAAAALTPTASGLANLTGMSLVPGVYAGGALSIDGAGTLTLVGDSTSVWVFTAASTLVTGSMSNIVLSGGASACNVFWRVTSSATLGTDSSFVGTVMAEQSITATTDTEVSGRLLASTGAVTLDSTNVTTPSGCAPPGSVVTTPEITSGAAPDGTVDTPYAFTVTATGTPDPTFTVTTGSLPTGLSLDATTGVIDGTPVTDGTSTFTITASNGTAPDDSVALAITVAAATGPAATLPATGADSRILLTIAALLAGAGAVLIAVRRRAPRLP